MKWEINTLPNLSRGINSRKLTHFLDPLNKENFLTLTLWASFLSLVLARCLAPLRWVARFPDVRFPRTDVIFFKPHSRFRFLPFLVNLSLKNQSSIDRLCEQCIDASVQIQQPVKIAFKYSESRVKN